MGLLLLLIGDAALVGGTFLAAYHARLAFLSAFSQSIKPTALADYQALVPFVVTIKLLCFHLTGLYGHRERLAEVWPELTKAAVLASGLLLIGVFWNKSVDYSRIVFALDCGLSILVLICWRAVTLAVRRNMRRRGVGLRNLLVVGRSAVADQLVCLLIAQPELGLRPCGYLAEQAAPPSDSPALELLGPPAALVEMVRQHKIDELLLAEPVSADCSWLGALSDCEDMGLEIKLIPTFASLVTGHARTVNLDGIPLLGIQPQVISGWNLVVKEVEDFILSLIALMVAAPMLALIALAIKRDSKGPILFSHDRIGKHGKRFTMYKFRTMREGAEQELERLVEQNEKQGAIFKIKDDPRLTRFGRWLRRSSLDELPQLLNVLKGEMSLVGPRPLPPYEVDLEDPWHQARMKVLPGITGLWQVNGRSDTAFEQMVHWDLTYSHGWSLWLDFTILLRTIPVVLFKKGAY